MKNHTAFKFSLVVWHDVITSKFSFSAAEHLEEGGRGRTDVLRLHFICIHINVRGRANKSTDSL